jgi:hypothetical protein
LETVFVDAIVHTEARNCDQSISKDSDLSPKVYTKEIDLHILQTHGEAEAPLIAELNEAVLIDLEQPQDTEIAEHEITSTVQNGSEEIDLHISQTQLASPASIYLSSHEPADDASAKYCAQQYLTIAKDGVDLGHNIETVAVRCDDNAISASLVIEKDEICDEIDLNISQSQEFAPSLEK